MMEHDLQSGKNDQQGSGDETPPDLPLVAGYQRLEDAILDDCFPEVDLALRRGRHIHKGDEHWFRFLSEAQGLLEPFYRRYGCELEQRSDGYFFLLPVSDGLGKRHLGVPEMIVGQGLALCYLDPQSVQSGGVVTREELLNQLASVMGTDALMNTLNPKRKRVDERVMQRTVRQKVNEALRRLSLLGFVELLDAEQLRLAPSLMRFAEPVRGLDAPAEALERLIERGEVSLGPGDAEPREGEEESDEPDDGGEVAETSAVGEQGFEGADAESTADAADADANSDADADAADADAYATADADSYVGADWYAGADSSAEAEVSTGTEVGLLGDIDADGIGADGPGAARAGDPVRGFAMDADTSEETSEPPDGAVASAFDGADAPASEAPAPRATLATPAATYEGFPANDRGHAEGDEDTSGDAEYRRDGLGERDAESSASIDGATHDGHWGDETARTASTERPAFEHVEIDFDWDTLPDEEA